MRRPGLGVVLLSPEINARLGLQGVGIERVSDGSAAATAGLRSLARRGTTSVELDEIVELDGQPVRSAQNLFDLLDSKVAAKTQRRFRP